MKAKIDTKQISSKYIYSWRLNNSFLNDEWVKEETKERIKISYNWMKTKHSTNKSLQHVESCSTRESFSSKYLLKSE